MRGRLRSSALWGNVERRAGKGYPPWTRVSCGRYSVYTESLFAKSLCKKLFSLNKWRQIVLTYLLTYLPPAMPAGMKSSNESPPLLSVLDQLLDGTPFVARCCWVCLSCACLLVSTVGLCGWCYQSTCPFHLHLLLMMRIAMLSWRQRIAYLSHTLSSHSKSYSGLGFREFRTSISLSLVTFRLSPLSFIRVFSDNSENLLNPVVLVPSVAVSVTKDFYVTRLLVQCPTPNLEGQWITFLLISTIRHVRHGWPCQLSPA